LAADVDAATRMANSLRLRRLQRLRHTDLFAAALMAIPFVEAS
jgi:hypothetical protein